MYRRNRRALAVFLWLAAIAWIAVLFFFSGQDGVHSSALSMRLARELKQLFPAIPLKVWELNRVLRKAAHFCIFALEGFLLGGALMVMLSNVRLGGMLTAVICVGLGALNEYHQSFSAGRSCEFRDVCIDSAGAILGVLLAAAILTLARRRKRRRRIEA